MPIAMSVFITLIVTLVIGDIVGSYIKALRFQKTDPCVVIEGIRVCSKEDIGENTSRLAPDYPVLMQNTDYPMSFAEHLRQDFSPICALHSHPHFISANKVMAPRPEAEKALKWITDRIGILPEFTLLSGEFSRKVGAFATIRKGKRYIVYDKDENFLTPDGVLDWASVGTLSHEISHHIAGHTAINNNDKHKQELEADTFAGFMLSKLGANKDQALEWTQDLNLNDTKTHPARHRRQKATLEGWHQAEKLKSIYAKSCRNEWLSNDFVLSHQACRIGHHCNSGVLETKLACKNIDGLWEWVH